MARWPSDMTVAVAADVSLAEANRRLAADDQWLSLDGPVNAALGVLAGADMTGPLRLGFGGWRDQLLGVQFLDGRNRLITAGGRAIKNVAGYDLTKFIIGQRGVFGQIGCLMLRTYRRPEAALVVKLAADVSQLNWLLALPQRPSWSVLDESALWVGYLGTELSVEAVARSLEGANAKGTVRQTAADDELLRARLTRWQPGEGEVAFTIWAAPSVVSGLMRQARVGHWWADAPTGLIRGCCQPSDAGRLAAVTQDLGFNFHVEGRPYRLSAGEAAVLRRLKARFDPDGCLNSLDVEVIR